MSARPFRVWSHDRNTKKGVTACSLEELVKKAKEKIGIPASECVQIVLEEDGTEVDDDDYFMFLPHNSTVMVLRQGEKWSLVGKENPAGHDEPDFMCGDLEISDRTKDLITGLQRDIGRLIAFSNEDLKTVVDLQTADLAGLLQDTDSYAQAVQEACQRHLDERTQTTEAMDLLRLYHQARQHSPYMGEDAGSKKQKLSHT